MEQNKIPTNKGNLSIPEIIDVLAYGSYAANRDYGISHEKLIAFGIGNEEFKKIYESEKNNHESKY